jgi:hypothetical protein
MRRILCFDPWESLKTPVPALYPEWGESLRHFPGTNIESFKAEMGVAYAEHLDPPECWLLVPQNKAQDDIEKTLGKLRQAVGEVADVVEPPIIILRWGTGRYAAQDGTLSLELYFAEDSQKAREFLLPLAVRAYFEIGKFLSSQDDRTHLKAIRLHGNPTALDPILEDYESALLRAASSLLHERSSQGSRPSQGRYFTTDHVSCGHSLKQIEIDSLSLGPLYAITRDERAIHHWLKEATERIAKEWLEYRDSIKKWYRDEMLAMNCRGPTEAKAEQPEELRERFSRQLRELENGQTDLGTGEELQDSIDELLENEKSRLYLVIRRRPTPHLFFLPAALLAGLAAIVTGPTASLIANPTGASWAWLLASVSSILLAAFVLLLHANLGSWQAIRSARRALEALWNRIEQEANSLREVKVSQLKALLLRRNLDIVVSEIEARESRKQKLDYHLRQLERHHAALNPIRSWRPTDDTDSHALPELDRPVEQNDVYFWQGHHGPEDKVKVATTERPLAEVDNYGRYAGVTVIEFVTGQA